MVSLSILRPFGPSRETATLRAGYELLYTPHIANVELWKTSGHFDFYADGMFDQMDVVTCVDITFRAPHAVDAAASARWRGDSTPSTRRRPRNLTHLLISTQVEKEQYQLKPMNCPFHCLVFKDQLRSYRDLPYRWAELGTVY